MNNPHPIASAIRAFLSGFLSGDDTYEVCRRLLARLDRTPTPVEKWAVDPLANRIADWYQCGLCLEGMPMSYHRLSQFHCTIQMLEMRVDLTKEWLDKASDPDLDAVGVDVPLLVSKEVAGIAAWAPPEVRIPQLLRILSFHRKRMRTRRDNYMMQNTIIVYPDALPVEVTAQELFESLASQKPTTEDQFLDLELEIMDLMDSRSRNATGVAG